MTNDTQSTTALSPVVFLSLGPGDPELLTLKAVRLLKEADAVMVPGTINAEGHLMSRAADIIEPWCEKRKQRLYGLPMERHRQAAMNVYDQIYQEVAQFCQLGMRVVVAVEGDASIYASIHYVLDRLLTAGIPVEQVPGIPSFIAAASAASLSLVSQHERLLVVPGDVDADELSQLLAHGHVVVVMKLSACEEAVKVYIQRNKAVECHYFENVGTSKAFDTGDSDAILKRRFPYFSLLMLRARRPVS